VREHTEGERAGNSVGASWCPDAQTAWSTANILRINPFLRIYPKEKTMDEYRHHVSGFFAHREEAEGAVTRLVQRGIPRDQLQLFDADSGPAVTEPSRSKVMKC
jgi:hypothetical protein